MPTTISIKKKLKKMWQVIYSSILGFWNDDCYTKASTLTFYTLQSIIPFLAAILAIAKVFGFDEYLEALLTKTFYEQKEIFTYAIQFALSTLEIISSGAIVGLGVLLLLWTNINLVGYIELTLNEIWKVKISRTLFQKIKDFSFALIVFPVIFVASGSATIYIESQIHNISYFADFSEVVISDIKFLLPWFLSCILFGMLYFLIPNARLQIFPRLIASILAGTAFQIWQSVFISLQVHIFSYNIVYGAFALLPLFLIWLQFSWIIALAGAEIAAHLENDNLNIQDNDSGFTKIKRNELALLVLNDCVASFYEEKGPFTLLSFSDRLNISQEAVTDVLSTLERNEIIIAFTNKDGETSYHPHYDPRNIKIQEVCDAIDNDLDRDVFIEESNTLPKIREALKALHNSIKDSKSNVSLFELFPSSSKEVLLPKDDNFNSKN
ncbi:MAG: YihY/virulence factor BrkB family protein [Parachlamydiaceae bacterium]|nr:YihY/virulence factor BrkB family protein [Parachlamydiaceae bacterium]